MIGEHYPHVAFPHPPHIFKNFKPILQRFGDLDEPENFKKLIEAVCLFIESNPVKWNDKNNMAIQFDRRTILNRCTKNNLVSLFEAVMDTYAELNDCQTWVCKSMTMSFHHQELLEHFGDRLKYIYLYRDPRDVCLSFRKVRSLKEIVIWNFFFISTFRHQLEIHIFTLLLRNGRNCKLLFLICKIQPQKKSIPSVMNPCFKARMKLWVI